MYTSNYLLEAVILKNITVASPVSSSWSNIWNSKNDGNVLNSRKSIFREQDTDFYEQVIEKLIPQSDKHPSLRGLR
jgi:hypothetical protein